MEQSQGKVGVILDDSLAYPEKVPFNPPKNYAECPLKDGLNSDNKVYPAVRHIFKLMNLDMKKYGTSDWSPLSEIIQKGQTVLIKPNLVLDRNLSGDSIFSVITHSSIIRAVVDYAYKATGENGKLIIADAPQNDACFQKLMAVTHLSEMVENLRDDFSIPLELCDLREEEVVNDGLIVARKALPGDPRGYVGVDLGGSSALCGLDKNYNKYYGADYDRNETQCFQNDKHHIYVLSRTALEADVIINLPKLKTHMKAGITVSLKNMVGLVGNKNSLVHFRIGSPSTLGDEFPEYTSVSKKVSLKFNRIYTDLFLSKGVGTSVMQQLIRIGGGARTFSSESSQEGFIHSGNWCGNDTIWRTVLDINKIITFSDKYGTLQDRPQRNFLNLVDGILGGEGQGPLAPLTKYCGTIICGVDPCSVDNVAAKLMGFDAQKIPLLWEALKDHKEPKIILSKNGAVASLDLQNLPNLHFKSPRGWNISTH